VNEITSEESLLLLAVDVDVLSDVEPPQGGWERGVIEEDYSFNGKSLRTTAEARATNFPPLLRPVLYGSGSGAMVHATRFRMSAALLQALNSGYGQGELSFQSVELLRALPVENSSRVPGILMMQLRITHRDLDELSAAVAALSHERVEAQRGFTRGGDIFSKLEEAGVLGTHVQRPDPGADTAPPIYPTVLFRTGQPGGGVDSPTMRDVELFAVASAQSPSKIHAAQTKVDERVQGALRLSRSWSALILRHGSAFQLHDAEGERFEQAEVYFRSLYADGIAFSRLQDRLLRALESRVRVLLLTSKADDVDASRFARAANSLNRSLLIQATRYGLTGLVASTGKVMDVTAAYRRAASVDLRYQTTDDLLQRLVEVSSADRDNRRETLIAAQVAAQERQNRLIALVGAVVLPATLVMDAIGLYYSTDVVAVGVGAASSVVLGVGFWVLLRAAGTVTSRRRRTPPPD